MGFPHSGLSSSIPSARIPHATRTRTGFGGKETFPAVPKVERTSPFPVKAIGPDLMGDHHLKLPTARRDPVPFAHSVEGCPAQSEFESEPRDY